MADLPRAWVRDCSVSHWITDAKRPKPASLRAWVSFGPEPLNPDVETQMQIYTDGGVMHNGMTDAYGAWAFVVVGGYESSGPLESTTCNRAELQAIIEAVRHAKTHGQCSVAIYSDSQICVNCGNRVWKRKANRDLWAEFDLVCAGIAVDLHWVRGHNGNPHNERADELCGIEMLRMDVCGEVAAQQPTIGLLC